MDGWMDGGVKPKQNNLGCSCRSQPLLQQSSYSSDDTVPLLAARGARGEKGGGTFIPWA